MAGSAGQDGGWVYALAPLLGIAAGWLQVKFGDLLLTALVVMSFTMLLGILRPQRPWRWMLLVATFVLLLQGAAFLFHRAFIARTDFRIHPGISHRHSRGLRWFYVPSCFPRADRKTVSC